MSEKEITQKVDFDGITIKEKYYDSSRLRPLKHIENLLNETQNAKERIDKKIKKILENPKTMEDEEENIIKEQNLNKRKKKVEDLLKKLRHERRLVFLDMLWNGKINFVKFSELVNMAKKNVMEGELIEEIRKKS